MNIVFRVDSSLVIGGGHLMRCLALAESFSNNGACVAFISRKHKGNLNILIREKGFQLFELPVDNSYPKQGGGGYSDWLGASWEDDAKEVEAILSQRETEVLFVDHYAIDDKWEKQVKLGCMRLVVIDDLANRMHSCDFLIDQTCDRRWQEYEQYVDKDCLCLLGSQYAILRSEFAVLRQRSLERRKLAVYDKILVSLGGVDKDNVTAEVLKALANCSLPVNAQITIVLGHHAPHKQVILDLVENTPYRTRLLIGVSNMGGLMADSDLAIGAAGSSAWERCCLGLPTIMIVIADNQLTVAKNLSRRGAAILLEGSIKEGLSQLFSGSISQQLKDVSTKSAQLVDGLGCDRIIDKLEIKS